MRTTLACLVTLLLAAVAAPSTLAASRCVAPPGSSAVDEYCEVVPDGTGGNAGPGGGSSGPSAGTSGVPSGTASELERSGAAGAAVLSLSGGRRESDRKAEEHNKDKDRGDGTTKPTHDDPQLPDRDQGTSTHNVVEAAAASTSDATRVGSGFIWALLGSVVVVGGWGWFAYRRRTRAAGPTDADGDGPSDA